MGGVNNGWAVAMTLLGFERGESAATMPIRFQAELDRLIALARERGVADDPIIRQRLAWCWSKVQIMRYLGLRTLTQFLAGHHPGPDGAISKLYWSEYHRVATELAVDILGADAMVPTGRAAVVRVPVGRCRRAELQRVVGHDVPQRPGRARSTPGRRRSSATSSARWSSACPRSREPRPPPGPSSRRPRSEGAGRRIDAGDRDGAGWRRRWPGVPRSGRPRLRQARRLAPIAGGGGHRSCPCRRRATSASGRMTQYGDADHPLEPDDVVRYLTWCRQWAAIERERPHERRIGSAAPPHRRARGARNRHLAAATEA